MGRAKKVVGACHIAEIKSTYKGTTYTTTLLRRTYREDGKVKHETLGNLTHLPPHALDLVRRALAGEQFVSAGQQSAPEGFRIERTLPHGNVAAVLGTLRKLGVHELLSPKPCREHDLVCAMAAPSLISLSPVRSPRQPQRAEAIHGRSAGRNAAQSAGWNRQSD